MGLPESYDDFMAQRLDKTGRDIMACSYSAYPEYPYKVECWTEDVLNAQRVAIFEKVE